MIKIYSLLFFVLLMSCGKAVKEEADEDVREEVEIDGSYAAILVPVNGKISSSVNGKVKLVKYGDQFQVSVSLNAGPGGNYTQYLHTGAYCPKMIQDLNGDGYLDAYEARKESGQILIPFDGDLSSQLSGASYVLNGNYRYTKSTSYYLMLADLLRPDDIINDSLIKLEDDDLEMERRTVLIYAQRRGLPPSVAGEEIPIACGILTKIRNYPDPNEDTWDTDSDYNPPSPIPRRPRPRPRPGPEPGPEPDPGPDTNDSDSWWERIRDRWNRWRGRGGGSN